MIDELLNLSDVVRYAAVYRDGELRTGSKAGTLDASAAESDRYEELLVNPTVLLLTSQRRNIDCGGLEYVVIRYGSFFQLVYPMPWGHVSVCLEKEADPVALASRLAEFLATA